MNIRETAERAARRYKALCRDTILVYEDLVAAAEDGVLASTKTYDPSYGTKPETYAHRSARNAIMRYIHNHARTVRVPVHASTAYGNWRTQSLNAPLKHNADACGQDLLSCERDTTAQFEAQYDVARLIAALPEPLKSTVQQKAEGASDTEIAERRGVTRQAVNLQLQRAYAKMRAAL